MRTGFIIYVGIAGIISGIFFLSIFFLHRINRIIEILRGKKSQRRGFIASLRNLLFILLWTASFTGILLAGFFLRAYDAFNFEEPVAEIYTHNTKQSQTIHIVLIHLSGQQKSVSQTFLIKGDQWMLEGDILKWDSFLNFLGLHTRYRLTRLRGRYLKTDEEIHKEATVYSLVPDENHPLWQYLYEFGQKLPLVNSVYGNAVFQTAGMEKHFYIFVSTSGFLAREVMPGQSTFQNQSN